MNPRRRRHNKRARRWRIERVKHWMRADLRRYLEKTYKQAFDMIPNTQPMPQDWLDWLAKRGYSFPTDGYQIGVSEVKRAP